MSATKYIIKQSHLGYDDEVYYTCGHSIYNVYTDASKAKTQLRALQLNRVRELPLGETSSLFNGEPSLPGKVDQFIKERTGKSVINEGGYFEYGVDIPQNMNDDDVLELGKMIGTLGYVMIEVDDNHSMHVLWDMEEDAPLITSDESGEFLNYADTEEQLLACAEEELGYALDELFEEQSSLEELSDSPELLKSMVESSKAMQFDDESSSIELHEELDSGEMKALNALLKKPFYSIKQMTLEEVIELEKNMEEY